MTLTTDAAIKSAIEHIQAGRWSDGAALCQQVLSKDPVNAPALHLLGVSAAQSGNFNQAIDLMRRAIASNPRIAEFHSNLSWYLLNKSRFAEAIAAAQQALQLQPRMAAAWCNLGHALNKTGKPLDAANAFVQVATLEPANIELQRLAGNGLLTTGQSRAAVEIFRRLTLLSPENLKAQSHYDLGVALNADRQYEQAVESYRRSVELNPQDEWAWNNLGNAYRSAGKLTEAADALREAIRLKPDWGEAHCNLATVYISQGEIDLADQTFQIALQKSPQQPIIHYNFGVLLLLKGDYPRGWPEYEWRWKCPQAQIPTQFVAPPWRGEPIENKTILLHAEQGLGDTIQFARYIPLVIERGAQVYLCVQPEAVNLLKNIPGVRQTARHPNQLPACQTHCYLMDLPLIFKTTLETIPAKCPYLEADPPLREKWSQKLLSGNDLKIGLAWAGRPTHASDTLRSIKLSEFSPLAKIPRLAFYSLQKGPGSEQAVAPPIGLNWIDLTPDVTDLADTAALISHLDLVITVDSAIAHLAAAFGKPVWILNRFAPDWRWLLNRTDSPWYPTARLFRQTTPGDWTPVLHQITRELATLAKSRS
jgi:Flp pilus assembly protein TadD